jgi:hypothetical protein
VRTLQASVLSAGGGLGFYWNGLDDAGKPVPDAKYRFTVTVASPYGCPSGFNYAWCNTTLYGNYFFFHYCVPAGGDDLLATGGVSTNALPGPPVCGSAATIVASAGSGIPRAFAVRQLPGRVDRVPIGLSRLGSHLGLRPSLSVDGTPVPAQPRVVDEVRELGVTAFQVNLPQASPVHVRIMDLQGRVVRDEMLPAEDPGGLVYRWDGRDRNGHALQPGVYIAQVGAGGAVRQTKLIVTQMAN